MTQDKPTEENNCCGHGSHSQAGASGEQSQATAAVEVNAYDENLDPVCGMTVDPATARAKVELAGRTFYFCCQGCATKFAAAPAAFINPTPQVEVKLQGSVRTPLTDKQNSAERGYTCPMHPEVISSRPGPCSACGMALEALLVDLQDDSGVAERDEITKRLSWSAALTVPLALLSMTHMLGAGIASGTAHGISHLVGCWAQFFLATPVVLWAALPIFQRGWTSVTNRSLNMFTLLSLGIGIPYVFSTISLVAVTLFIPQSAAHHVVYFESAAVIATLAWLGQLLESRARLRSASAIRALVQLLPADAEVILADGREVSMPASAVPFQAKVRVRPGERLPVDGIVLDGVSAVIESMLTGESLPVVKQAGSQVSAGTINTNGSLIVQTERAGSDTLVSQIVKLVSQAQRSRVPVQQLADKVAAVFVPVVIGVALLTLIGWLVAGGTLTAALSAAVTVLVVACPCALGLATPMSIVVATGRAAKAGVLFKEARSLQQLAGVHTLVIDKTGTLTEGAPRLVAVVSAGNLTSEELLDLAASLEVHSEHPLAAALLAAHTGRALLPCQAFVTTPGGGVSATVSGRAVVIGTESYLRSFSIDCSKVSTIAADNHSTCVFMSVAGKCEGRLDFADQIRPHAAAAVKELQARGIKVIMASGDNLRAAQHVATALGITTVYAAMLPGDKASLIKDLQGTGLKVAMAGDGINDAPALAQANVGLAMAAGTDIAVHSADIVLLHSDIAGIVRAHKMSKAMLRNISENLVLAFGYNLIAIPVATGLFNHAIGFVIDPMAAAAAMSVSSLLVIANALRLQSVKL